MWASHIGALTADGWGVVALWGATAAGGPIAPLPEVHYLIALLVWAWLLPLAHAVTLPADSIVLVSVAAATVAGAPDTTSTPRLVPLIHARHAAMTRSASFAPYALLLVGIPLACTVVVGVCYGTGALLLSPIALPGLLVTWVVVGVTIRRDAAHVRGRGSDWDTIYGSPFVCDAPPHAASSDGLLAGATAM
jgi:hypothetical protein